ncbi:MAG: hypothetical protein OHK0011_25030 [Turneriella sp.]
MIMRRLESLLFAVGTTALAAAGQQNAASGTSGTETQKDLARVAIVTFVNATQDKNYAWVENSLPEAIDGAMRQKFEYQSLDARTVQNIADAERKGNLTYTPEVVERIAQRAGADIIIYGNFTLEDTATDGASKSPPMIRVNAHVFKSADKKLIGTIAESSETNNRIFRQIDHIADEVVKSIYRYALQASERSAAQAGQDKKLRLLVLVPSYATEREQALALKELEELKRELRDRYEGEFLTIFEYFERFRVAPAEQEKLTAWAQSRESGKVAAWLTERGVRDAFVILVEKKKVAITPVVAGTEQTPITYASGATPGRRQNAVSQMVAVSQIQAKEIRETDKTRLSKTLFAEQRTARLRLMPGGWFALNSMGDYVPVAFGGQLILDFAWLRYLRPVIALNAEYAPGKISSNRTLLSGASAGLLWNFRRMGRFDLGLMLTGGAQAAQVTGKPFAVIAMGSAGILMDYRIDDRYLLSCAAFATYYADKDVPGLTTAAYVGLGLAF